MEIWKYLIILNVIILLILIGSSVIYKDNFAILNGKITLSNGSGSTTANYPTGFTYKNCIALAIGIDIYGEGCFSYNIAGQMVFEARLTDTIINIKSISIDGIGSSSTKNYRLILMKI